MPITREIAALRRTLRNAVATLNARLFGPTESGLRWYYLLLFAAFAVYQLARPIMLGDTDMWYHLAGGRFFWAHGQVPDTAYFSFAAPDRAWTAYFWGFQAVIYKIHETFGYQGLVVARALLFIASIGMVGLYLKHSNRGVWTWAAICVAIAYFILLEGRAFQLRPHLISYALIPAFLYILEYRRKWLPLLPALTVLWANLHGVEWVIGAAIVGAYFLERAFALKRCSDKPAVYRDLGWMIACAPALLVNPFGATLLLAPFAMPPGLGDFIAELRPLSPHAFLTLYVGTNGIGIASVLTLLTLLTIAAIVRSLLSNTVRLSHLILAICGFVLLTRGNRFVYEWAFLILPAVGSVVPALRAPKPPDNLAPIPIMLALSFLVAPLAFLVQKLAHGPTGYPFAAAGLPVGTANFLATADVQGNLLASPTYGGFINWKLFPAMRIHSDMEFPPFNATDNLELNMVLTGNQAAIEKFAAKYQVHFLLAHLGMRDTAIVIAERLKMKPVFFDDAFVLYATDDRRSELPTQLVLETVDPFNLSYKTQDKGTYLAELLSIRDQWPDGARVNHALARFYLDQKNFVEAERYARHFAKVAPRDPNGEYLLGNVAEQTDQFDLAIEHYRASMRYADTSFHRVVYRHIGSCHYLSKRFAESYEAFRRSINLFTPEHDPEILYQYAFTAVATGHPGEASRALHALIWGADADHTALRDKAQALLNDIDSGVYTTPTLLDFLKTTLSREEMMR